MLLFFDLPSTASRTPKGPFDKLCLYCLSSDGDSKRRRALVSIIHVAPLSSMSSIYPLLSQLSLFNLVCGPDELTADFDYKHIGKRCRNTLTRKHGLRINGVAIMSGNTITLLGSLELRWK